MSFKHRIKHRKILRDNMQGLTKPVFQRLSHQAGVKSLSALMYEVLRGVTKIHLEMVLKASITYMEHDRRKTLSLNDVLYGIEETGSKVAFSNAMTKAAKICKQ